MKKTVLCLALLAAVTLIASNAIADSIKNRLGVTGKVGFIVPSDSSEVATGSIGTDVDFIGGGGFIYGITDIFAAELDITHSGFGSNAGLDFDVTNVSLGAQVRFANLPSKALVPYFGAGLDILLNGVSNGSVDDTVGAHVSGGLDYFLINPIAVNVEVKGVFAPNADFKSPSGVKIGNFDPTSFSMTFGVRYFFN